MFFGFFRSDCVVSVFSVSPWWMGLVLLFMTCPAWAFTFSEGRKAYEKGDYQKAEEYFRQKASGAKKDPDPAYSLGGALYRQGKYDQAGSAFEDAVGKGQDLSSGWYNLGNSYFRLDRFKDAIQAYEKALSLDPKDEDAKFNMELAKKRLEKDPRKDKSRSQDKQKQDDQDQQQKKDQGDKQEPSAGKEKGDQKQKEKGEGQGQGSPQDQAKADQQRRADRQRQEKAKKELGLSDKQIQDLMKQMQDWEANTQRYFSKDPKRERQKAGDPWSHLPAQQREFLNRFFGKPVAKEPAVREDW
jgi:Ca-activated chloride channel family protein